LNSHAVLLVRFGSALLLAILSMLPDTAQATDPLDVARQAGVRMLTDPAKPEKGLRVLILCDSMGLNGFADELDASFRACPGVSRVHTIAACGTNPLSWMKRPPYSAASTHCGFLRIDSTSEPSGVNVERDVYGIPAGHKPSGHRVPKVEDLVAEIQPDILILQNGNNFFDLFQGTYAAPEKAVARMRSYLAPFRQWLLTVPSIRHFYWISPPQAGHVTQEIQQAVFDAIKEEVEPHGHVIDSRAITRFPYKAQSSDLMHFWGDEAFDWGRDSFRLIVTNLGGRPSHRPAQLPTSITPTEAPVEIRRAIPVEDDAELMVRVRLEKLTPIPDPSTFAPYGDLLVAGLYRVLKVKSGSYTEKRIVIVHPAYINHQPQNLSLLKPRRSYEFLLRELTGESLWATARRQDSVGPFELSHYYLAVDEARHPSHSSQNTAP